MNQRYLDRLDAQRNDKVRSIRAREGGEDEASVIGLHNDFSEAR